MKKIFLLGIISCFLMACKSDKVVLKPLDLLPHGVPLTIMAPDSANVKVEDRTYFKDVTIEKAEDFGVNIMVSPITETDLSKLKQKELTDLKESPYFSEVVKDETAGFIYKSVVDSTHTTYDFRYFQVKGDTEYKFSNTPVVRELKDVERIYEAIKQK